MNILVAGLGKLGSVMAALLANAGHTVIGVDPNARTRDDINAGRPPVDEPGLGQLIAALERDQLTAVDTDHWTAAVGDTDAAMIVVPTPSLPAGGFDSDLVVGAVSEIAMRAKGSARKTPYLIVVCSTLSPGQMASDVAPAVEKWSGLTVGEGVLLAYSPEFIALGTVIDDMMSPDMLLIGSQDRRSARATVDLSATFRRPGATHCMTFTEAETTKLAINGYLSLKIGYANEIGAAIQMMGGNPETVLSAIGADRRIGSAYLHKGGPPTGPCLPRDLVALEALGARIHRPMHLATAARAAAKQVVLDVVTEAGMSHGAPRIALLGVAYKPGSPITDDSLARSIIQRASHTGTQLFVYDPHAELPRSFPFQHRRCATLNEALDDAAIVIIGCPHPEFDSIDFGKRKVINPWQ